MSFQPLDRLWDRLARAREDSDTAYFHDLVYGGEMVLKLIVAGLVAALNEDRDRHRYRQLHRLVRAVGLREWATTADQGAAGAGLRAPARPARPGRPGALQFS